MRIQREDVPYIFRMMSEGVYVKEMLILLISFLLFIFEGTA